MTQCTSRAGLSLVSLSVLCSPMYAQVVSETFCESDMPPAKVAEMFAEADWDGSGRVRNPSDERFRASGTESSLSAAQSLALSRRAIGHHCRALGPWFARRMCLSFREAWHLVPAVF